MTTPTIKTEEELREEFRKRFLAPIYASYKDATTNGFTELGNVDQTIAIADWWLSQMASYKETLYRDVRRRLAALDLISIDGGENAGVYIDFHKALVAAEDPAEVERIKKEVSAALINNSTTR